MENSDYAEHSKFFHTYWCEHHGIQLEKYERIMNEYRILPFYLYDERALKVFLIESLTINLYKEQRTSCF
jgi:hypothetical protein